MGNKIKIAAAGAGIVITMIFCYLFLLDTDREIALAPQNIPAAGDGSPAAVPSDAQSIASPGFSTVGPSDNTTDVNQMSIKDKIIRELQKNYGDTISEISTQASLYGVRNYILGMFPEEGEKTFSEIIKQAFPDFADAIMATLKKLDVYNEWLADNEAILAQMSESEKSAALWEKREALFGEAAKEIWSGELLATDARKKTMQDTMAVLQESRDTTIEEKLEMFQTALHETYDNSPEEFILEYKDMSAKIFFSLDSVQEELKGLPPDQRQFEMNKIRREMGFSQDDIEKMQEYDAVRNQRWEVGLAYMAERDAVVAASQGKEQEEKLKALREKYFQDEAQTIELEEKDDFFRFKRERVHGRN
ncbi:MAG: hypothetical protein C4518_13900 [Desulfobacteraceae bacterium]|nr:MAG: hypothetical protein C4518_13900 [Desulfobacteraceae bacterium]